MPEPLTDDEDGSDAPHAALRAEIHELAERHGVMALVIVAISPTGAEVETLCSVPALNDWAAALNDAVSVAVEEVGDPPQVAGRA